MADSMKRERNELQAKQVQSDTVQTTLNPETLLQSKYSAREEKDLASDNF